MLKNEMCSGCGMERNTEDCCKVGRFKYIFDWVGGGYNTTKADSVEDAIKKVTKRGKSNGGRSTLIPIENSFRIHTNEEEDYLLKVNFCD